jgi:hypothetical protein
MDLVLTFTTDILDYADRHHLSTRYEPTIGP